MPEPATYQAPVSGRDHQPHGLAYMRISLSTAHCIVQSPSYSDPWPEPAYVGCDIRATETHIRSPSCGWAGSNQTPAGTHETVQNLGCCGPARPRYREFRMKRRGMLELIGADGPMAFMRLAVTSGRPNICPG